MLRTTMEPSRIGEARFGRFEHWLRRYFSFARYFAGFFSSFL
jgi:hypothetical protein